MMRRIHGSELEKKPEVTSAEVLATVSEILADVRRRGDEAVRHYATTLDGLASDAPLVCEWEALEHAREDIDTETRALLERTAARIEEFARAQLACFSELTAEVDGGQAGHRLIPVSRAGCYAPGGRYPLPSSVLMSAIPARVAGVADITVATPGASEVMLAAAAVAGASRVVPVGGAQAIAALAYGTDSVPGVDVIVGPGNRWVTAAKKLVFGRVGIDMLAGPTELVIIADETARPDYVAADLLAQAEHDIEARAWLVTTNEELADAVDEELARQLDDLPTADVARAAITESAIALVDDLDEAVAVADRLAPEHLQICTEAADTLVPKLRHSGSLFLGNTSAEVFGDYGIGPNHTLPTSGAARYTGGLSVLNFVRITTWLRLDQTPACAADAIALAECEGLFAHARAARKRISQP